MDSLAQNIKYYRKLSGLTQKELAKKLSVAPTAISAWEVGRNQPLMNNIEQMSAIFGIKKSLLLGEDFSSHVDKATSPIQTIYDELKPPRQAKVLNYAKRQLDEQKNEEETKINEVSEKVIDLYQVEVVSETAAASGFNYGFGYDDTDRETIEVDQQPLRHDIATKVSGDSMQPDYQDGDILYLVDKGLTTYNGDLAVIAYGDRSYFKKIYTENGRLRLVSLNDKYEDITLDFPPAEDTHIKIYAVIGVYRGE
ncbi:S24 family peptidase [Streptococcus pseudopneumoniae]|uniref:S24 family peptidase n=4 Tax=Streptococcus TaxID=1301 RepID=UPI0018B085DD|nr:S24 family peptidase [Streptococcus pseudopneumoniae]MBF9649927.1 helix-turn-helix domain-containing protein [Streptococcus pseudopneumoniae]